MKSKHPSPAVAGITYKVGVTGNNRHDSHLAIKENSRIDITAAFNRRILFCYEKIGQDNIIVHEAKNWTAAKICTTVGQSFTLCVVKKDHVAGIKVSVINTNGEYQITEEEEWRAILDHKNMVRGVSDRKTIRVLKKFMSEFTEAFQLSFRSSALNM